MCCRVRMNCVTVSERNMHPLFVYTYSRFAIHFSACGCPSTPAPFPWIREALRFVSIIITSSSSCVTNTLGHTQSIEHIQTQATNGCTRFDGFWGIDSHTAAASTLHSIHSEKDSSDIDVQHHNIRVFQFTSKPLTLSTCDFFLVLFQSDIRTNQKRSINKKAQRIQYRSLLSI